MKNEVQIQFKT